MKKRLSELTPAELITARLFSALSISLLSAVWFFVFLPKRTFPDLVYAMCSIFSGIAWFVFGHRLTLWLERKMQKGRIPPASGQKTR